MNTSYAAYPTMITPYNENGSIDLGAVDALVEWYWETGCDGIFTACQSSEIWYMTEDERVLLTKQVKKRADALASLDANGRKMTIVASGHISSAPADQAHELCRIAECGVDAVILITNRFDIDYTDKSSIGDSAWISECGTLLESLPDIPMGLYECPYPYKRLLTPAMLEWTKGTGRFKFIKDTCCDSAEIRKRTALLKDSNIKLFNANAQTLLPSLFDGAAGYCGIMCNFHPRLYVWLTRNIHHPNAKIVANFLSISAFTESLAYPVTAKYHLRENISIPMTLNCRSRPAEAFGEYDRQCITQMHEMAEYMQEVCCIP